MNAILLLALAFLLSPGVYSQTGSGRIQGTVKDATGAVVPGAKLTLTPKSLVLLRAARP